MPPGTSWLDTGARRGMGLLANRLRLITSRGLSKGRRCHSLATCAVICPSGFGLPAGIPGSRRWRRQRATGIGKGKVAAGQAKLSLGTNQGCCS